MAVSKASVNPNRCGKVGQYIPQGLEEPRQIQSFCNLESYLGRGLFQPVHEGGPGAADGLALLVHHAAETLLHAADQRCDPGCRVNGPFGHHAHGFRHGNPDLVCFRQLHHFTGLDLGFGGHLPQSQGDPVDAFRPQAYAGSCIPNCRKGRYNLLCREPKSNELLGCLRHLAELEGGLGCKVLHLGQEILGFFRAPQHIGEGGLCTLETGPCFHRSHSQGGQPGPDAAQNGQRLFREIQGVTPKGGLDLTFGCIEFFPEIGGIRPDLDQKVSDGCHVRQLLSV